MTTRTQQAAGRRWVLPFLAAFVAVLATILSTATASAATTATAETRVRASVASVEVLVEPPQREAAGQRLGNVAAGSETVVATGVAANNGRLLAKADRIERHLTRLDHSPANDAMLARIRGAASGGTPLSRADRAFMRHESTEGWLMDRGVGYGTSHRVAGWTHRTYGNYDPSVIKQYPELFNHNWRNFWGIE